MTEENTSRWLVPADAEQLAHNAGVIIATTTKTHMSALLPSYLAHGQYTSPPLERIRSVCVKRSPPEMEDVLRQNRSLEEEVRSLSMKVLDMKNQRNLALEEVEHLDRQNKNLILEKAT